MTIAIDFDGVIHSYEHGWHDGTIYGDFNSGAMPAIEQLMKHDAVFVHTTRMPRQVARWLERTSQYHIDCTTRLPRTWYGRRKPFWSKRGVLLVTNFKLPATVYLDDRAMRFESWEQALRNLGLTEDRLAAVRDVVADMHTITGARVWAGLLDTALAEDKDSRAREPVEPQSAEDASAQASADDAVGGEELDQAGVAVAHALKQAARDLEDFLAHGRTTGLALISGPGVLKILRAAASEVREGRRVEDALLTAVLSLAHHLSGRPV